MRKREEGTEKDGVSGRDGRPELQGTSLHACRRVPDEEQWRTTSTTRRRAACEIPHLAPVIAENHGEGQHPLCPLSMTGPSTTGQPGIAVPADEGDAATPVLSTGGRTEWDVIWPFCPQVWCRTTGGATASLSSLSQIHREPRGCPNRQADHTRR
jgi:hypothetical protein